MADEKRINDLLNQAAAQAAHTATTAAITAIRGDFQHLAMGGFFAIRADDDVPARYRQFLAHHKTKASTPVEKDNAFHEMLAGAEEPGQRLLLATLRKHHRVFADAYGWPVGDALVAEPSMERAWEVGSPSALGVLQWVVAFRAANPPTPPRPAAAGNVRPPSRRARRGRGGGTAQVPASAPAPPSGRGAGKRG